MGDPAWLTDRPEPRSAYLFGDDPEQPADDARRERPAEAWREQPTGRWSAEPTPRDEQPTGSWHRDLPTGDWRDESTTHWSAERTGRWAADQSTGRPYGPAAGDGAAEPSTGGWTAQTTGDWATGSTAAGPAYGDRPADRYAGPATGAWAAYHDTDPATGTWSAHGERDTAATDTWPAYRAGNAAPATDGWAAYGDRDGGPVPGGWPADDATAPISPAAGRDADGGQGDAEGRHRSRRRFPRPLVIGGAAAAATLVVSLGVGALAMPGGDTADPSAVDDTVAAGPALPTDETFPGDALAAPSATASPTTARPTPSASRTSRPTPAPSRTTAPSRRNVDRSSAPSAGGTTTAPSGTVSAQAREVVDLVNAERAKAGCKALTIDDKLMTAAQRHSQDQADHRNMSHTGSDGSNAGTRIERVGYQWRTYGENVAWNQKTPAAVMDAWMNSSGHRANILNCAFTEIGVGIASSNGPYWTQVFAAPR
ncbi:CAP domain-containing protein [Micromonospora sp. WMMD812]|uniref:CAP domain-containing protein n=1 Tax=Micromonospora sp. WMMD812 TaxID=3015152 RepID=UPI00248C363E|nr:CAP domain-containing protein [Micromonospora sp. WMMD812]WBB70458.1 CAP domain-containing protein [Micromonospora sp. WMMD812]